MDIQSYIVILPSDCKANIDGIIIDYTTVQQHFATTTRSISFASWHLFRSRTKAGHVLYYNSPTPICYNVNGRKKNISLRSTMMHWVVALGSFYDALAMEPHESYIVILYCSWTHSALETTGRWSS